MEKYKNKPKTLLISDEYHTEFNAKLNQALSKLWEDGIIIYEIKTFCNKDYVFALIIYSSEKDD